MPRWRLVLEITERTLIADERRVRRVLTAAELPGRLDVARTFHSSREMNRAGELVFGASSGAARAGRELRRKALDALVQLSPLARDLLLLPLELLERLARLAGVTACAHEVDPRVQPRPPDRKRALLLSELRERCRAVVG
jgi:hypothetical protein